MSRLIRLAIVPVMVAFLAGCQATGKQKGEGQCKHDAQTAGQCHKVDAAKGGCCAAAAEKPACAKASGTDKPACTYCPKSKMLTGYTGTVHDQKCNKDWSAGSYCAACNRFMVPGTVHCDKCNKDFPAGAYCSVCKKYMGVSGVSYCEHCKAPCAADKGCPGCSPKKS